MSIIDRTETASSVVEIENLFDALDVQSGGLN